MQTARISFRASPAISAELALRASKAGCSVSEYLRAVVREKVGLN
jgi:predicted HicB family RNase H-like nuclease